MKPLIGLTPTPEVKEQEHGTFRLHTLNQSYSLAVIQAGGIPVMLPSNNTDISALLDRLDGVIITGGGDIDPAIFGQDPHETTDGIDPERDEFEHALALQAIERDMPLLGICRGLQVLNVALGGTLHQDIDALIDGSGEHRQQKKKVGHDKTFQTAVLSEGEHPLRTMTVNDTLEINSFHHQSIETVADSLRVMAQTEDGVIEAVYNPDRSYCLAVQWHPELLQQDHAEHASIFQALVHAAKAYQSKESTRKVPELV